MIKSISDIRIGIVIISISLLSLLYPLMYSYLANLMQQLFDLLTRIKDKEKKEKLCEDAIKVIEKASQRIEDYYLISSFTLNVFFPTGLGFIFSFILLQFYNDGHLGENFGVKFSLCLIISLLFLLVLLLWRLDIKPHQKKWYDSINFKKYPLPPGLFILLYCAYLIYFLIVVLTTLKIQYYCLLLHYGFLLSCIVVFWFAEGIVYKTIRNLQKLRETLL